MTRFRFLFITALSLASAHHAVIACVTPGHIGSISNTWPGNASIEVNPSNFPSQGPLSTAWTNWSTSLKSKFPCTTISLSGGNSGNWTINVNYTAIPLQGGQTVRGVTHLDQLFTMALD